MVLKNLDWCQSSGFGFEAGEAARKALLPFAAEDGAGGNIVAAAGTLRTAKESEPVMCELSSAIECARAVLEMNGKLLTRFECGAEAHRWLNDVLAIGVGRQTDAGPVYTIHEIL